jgi:hypothetical protein
MSHSTIAISGRPMTRPDEQVLDHVAEPHPRRHAVETEALLDAEVVVPLERQLEQAADQAEGEQQGDLACETWS